MNIVLEKGQKFWERIKETFKSWNEIDPFNTSNVIAYYAIFSLPGLLVIVINLAGYFFGREAVTHQITAQLGGVIGGDTAKDIQEIIANASKNKGTVLSSVLGVLVLIFGATGVFYQLQQILNKIWGVEANPKQKVMSLIKGRLFSFGLILVIAFLLLISLVLSAGLSALSDWVALHISEYLLVVFRVLDITVSVTVITLLFAALYKFLPDAKISWRDVWGGALLTSVLFVIAKFALGLYFGTSNPASTYGAAGSIILIMLWVSYAGLILLFGAVYTKVTTLHRDKKIAPSEGAVLIEKPLFNFKG